MRSRTWPFVVCFLTVLAGVGAALGSAYGIALCSVILLLGAVLLLAIDSRRLTGRLLQRTLASNRAVVANGRDLLSFRKSVVKRQSALFKSVASVSRHVKETHDLQLSSLHSVEEMLERQTKEDERSTLTVMKMLEEVAEHSQQLERRILAALEGFRLSSSDRSQRTEQIIRMSDRRLIGLLEAERLAIGDRQERLIGMLKDIQERQTRSTDGLIGLSRELDGARRLALDKVESSASGVLTAVDGLTQLVNDLGALQRSALDKHELGASSVMAAISGVAAQIVVISQMSRDLHLRVEEFGDGLKPFSLPDKDIAALAALGRKNVDSTVRQLTAAARDETRQVEALLQLMPRIDPRAPMPPSGRWAMDARALLHLSHLVAEHKPRRIVEIGGGTSTVWLGYLTESLGTTIVSLDHDERFAQATARMIESHNLTEHVDVRLAPLEPIVIDGSSYMWYAGAAFEDLSDVDMLIVDGPPASTGKSARYPALPMLFNQLSKKCVLILDDSDREDEREALRLWTEAYPEFSPGQSGVSRLAVLHRT